MTVNRELCVQQRGVTVMFPVCDQISALSFIVFSGQVNGRTYKADLELQADVATERCCWEMKSNEPVLKLVKKRPGYWDRLLRNKVVKFILISPQQKLILRPSEQKSSLH